MEWSKQNRIAIANNSEKKSREYATKLKDIKQEDINKRQEKDVLTIMNVDIWHIISIIKSKCLINLQ